MKIVWDPEKAFQNRNKHNISFADAEIVLSDPLALTREDDDAIGEQRFVTLGVDTLGRILVVVYAYQQDKFCRIISARKATSVERCQYEEGI